MTHYSRQCLGGFNGEFLLVKGAAHLRENVVGIRSDEPNRADYEHEDDSQHHRIFRNVLTFISEEKGE